MNEGEFSEKMSGLAFLLRLFTNAMFEKKLSPKIPTELFLIVLEPVRISRKVPIITKA